MIQYSSGCYAASSDFSLPFPLWKVASSSVFFSGSLTAEIILGSIFRAETAPCASFCTPHCYHASLPCSILFFYCFTDFLGILEILFLLLVLVTAQFWTCDTAVSQMSHWKLRSLCLALTPFSPGLNSPTHYSYICLQSPSHHHLISEEIGINWSQISTIVSSGIWQLNDLERLEKEIFSPEGFVPLEQNARVLLTNNFKILQKLYRMIFHSLFFIFFWLRSCLAVVFSQAIKFRLELFTLLLWPFLPEL